jgi:hypothetical protein
VKTEGDYAVIALDVAVQVPNAGLQRLLRAIEITEPTLAVEQLVVESRTARSRRTPRVEPPLRARIRVQAVVVTDG